MTVIAGEAAMVFLSPRPVRELRLPWASSFWTSSNDPRHTQTRQAGLQSFPRPHREGHAQLSAKQVDTDQAGEQQYQERGRQCLVPLVPGLVPCLVLPCAQSLPEWFHWVHIFPRVYVRERRNKGGKEKIQVRAHGRMGKNREPVEPFSNGAGLWRNQWQNQTCHQRNQRAAVNRQAGRSGDSGPDHQISQGRAGPQSG